MSHNTATHSISTPSSVHDKSEHTSTPRLSPMLVSTASTVSSANTPDYRAPRKTEVEKLSELENITTDSYDLLKTGTTTKATAQVCLQRLTIPRRDVQIACDDEKRYVVVPEAQGGHQHRLEGTKREERLLRNLRGCLYRSDKPIVAAQQFQKFSIRSSWSESWRHLSENESSEVGSRLAKKYGQCQEVVGRGSFGIVKLSHKRYRGGVEQLFAVKEIQRLSDESKERYHKRIASEFHISMSLLHHNIVQTFDMLPGLEGEYSEVMEFCGGGDLFTLILSSGKLEIGEADCFFKQLMQGIDYLHKKGIAHRDIKPENLLLTVNGTLKIADFGAARYFRSSDGLASGKLAGICGSMPYNAPELYFESSYDGSAIDIWAAGVVYMVMRTGRYLWAVASKEDCRFVEYERAWREKRGYDLIERLSRPSCLDVIYGLLNPDPISRLKGAHVLRSKWLSETQLCIGRQG